MGDTFGSSFSARPTPAAAAYCTREAVHSFAGYDYSSRHKDRWAPALDRLLSLRRRIELGHPRSRRPVHGPIRLPATAGHLSGSDRATRCPTGRSLPPRGRH
jgi:hypothetical protein